MAGMNSSQQRLEYYSNIKFTILLIESQLNFVNWITKLFTKFKVEAE